MTTGLDHLVVASKTHTVIAALAGLDSDDLSRKASAGVKTSSKVACHNRRHGFIREDDPRGNVPGHLDCCPSNVVEVRYRRVDRVPRGNFMEVFGA